MKVVNTQNNQHNSELYFRYNIMYNMYLHNNIMLLQIWQNGNSISSD